MEEHGWRCGVPLDVETPGMMDGLAGIGYELLRLAEPSQIPSVLILEEPRGISSRQSAQKPQLTRAVSAYHGK